MTTDLASAIRLRCPDCLAVFRSAFTFCPADGATLIQCVEEPLIGATIAERYVLEELIGEGAMGLVYRASHVRLPRKFAIKILFGDMASDTRMRLRFAQEASAACRLNHPNVVTVVDFGKSDRGLLYLVMDYVEGETLSQLIEREAPLAERQVIELSRQLCEGLAHAHQNGIIHRDFKPDNVVLEPSDGAGAVPRILDFGLAITSNDDVFDGRLTQHGWVVGTPAYLSPEQARDEEVDQRADLYALGVVMYEMLAGVPPFDGTAMEVAHRNMLEPPQPIKVRNPLASVSPELERVVRRLLEKDPDDRFATAEEVVGALDHIDETYDYGISAGMAALVLGDDPPAADPVALAEPFLPLDELRPRRLRR
ncbi:MAG TPA: serine/threonine-protein kinase, partial [Kofleriaceae bacterium]|nr:serine/threonine-protein kinase [Kofleriaceae bacterium]